jgi:pimeloyl-ACP methyl ester carboxylesterase
MQDMFIETQSGRIHAVVNGEGEAVILVHGYSVEVNSWRTWERNVDALAEHFRVYALDLLGYGESDKLEPRLDVGRQAQALVHLLEAENIAQSSFIGLSWGGQIVQELALAAPGQGKKIVLVDSALDAGKDGLARLGKIVQPTLIIWDEDDVVIPVRAAYVLKKAIPDSQLAILAAGERDPGADPQNRHWTQTSHSVRFNQIVNQFLLSKRV